MKNRSKNNLIVTILASISIVAIGWFVSISDASTISPQLEHVLKTDQHERASSIFKNPSKNPPQQSSISLTPNDTPLCSLPEKSFGISQDNDSKKYARREEVTLIDLPAVPVQVQADTYRMSGFEVAKNINNQRSKISMKNPDPKVDSNATNIPNLNTKNTSKIAEHKLTTEFKQNENHDSNFSNNIDQSYTPFPSLEDKIQLSVVKNKTDIANLRNKTVELKSRQQPSTKSNTKQLTNIKTKSAVIDHDKKSIDMKSNPVPESEPGAGASGKKSPRSLDKISKTQSMKIDDNNADPDGMKIPLRSKTDSTATGSNNKEIKTVIPVTPPVVKNASETEKNQSPKIKTQETKTAEDLNIQASKNQNQLKTENQTQHINQNDRNKAAKSVIDQKQTIATGIIDQSSTTTNDQFSPKNIATKSKKTAAKITDKSTKTIATDKTSKALATDKSPASSSKPEAKVTPKQVRPKIGKNGKLTLPDFVLPEEDLEHFDLPSQIASRKIYDHRNVVLPKTINKKQFGENNQHLPTAVYHQEYSTMIFQAVDNDDISTLKALLTRGANINSKEQKNGHTPLMQAIKTHKNRAARYLIMRGAKTELKANDGKTALHLAAINNDFEMMKLLLIAKASIMAIDNSSRRPCEYISSDLRRNARTLVDYYPNANDALVDFAKLGSMHGVQKALQRGANINFREIRTGGDTALIIAAKCHDIKLVSLLLNAGASIEPTNNSQITAQQAASQKGYNDVADIIRTIKVQRDLEHVAGGEIEETIILSPARR